MMMLLALPGLMLLTASIACFVYFLPRKGQVHPWVVLPTIDTVIPLGIITGMIFGVIALALAFT